MGTSSSQEEDIFDCTNIELSKMQNRTFALVPEGVESSYENTTVAQKVNNIKTPVTVIATGAVNRAHDYFEVIVCNRYMLAPIIGITGGNELDAMIGRSGQFKSVGVGMNVNRSLHLFGKKNNSYRESLGIKTGDRVSIVVINGLVNFYHNGWLAAYFKLLLYCHYF